MAKIKGITIILYEKVQTGEDGFHHPVYEEKPVEVEDVLVSPTSTTDITGNTNLSGKKTVYTMAIPKGDTHEWEGRTVEFWGKKWKVVGIPLEGIDELLPLKWNKKVTVERYE